MTVLTSRFSSLLERAFFSRGGGVAIFAFLLTFAMAHPTLADGMRGAGNTEASWTLAASLGDMVCNAYANIGIFGEVFNWLAYTAGTFFVMRGMLLFVRHTENAGQTKLHSPFIALSFGGMLLVMPYVTATLITTLFQYQSGGGLGICMSGGVTSGAGGNITLDMMLVNLITNIYGPFMNLLSVISIIAGVFFILKGLLKGARYEADPNKGNSITSVVTHFTIGTILVAIGTSFDLLTTSLFGFSSYGAEGIATSDILSWNIFTTLSQDGSDVTHFARAVAAALRFFQLIGALAFLRGWLIVKSASEGSGQATMAQGFTHILGGVVAVNVIYFLEIMDYTFGTNFTDG